MCGPGAVFILLFGGMEFHHGIKTIGVGIILAHGTTKIRSIKVVLTYCSPRLKVYFRLMHRDNSSSNRVCRRESERRRASEQEEAAWGIDEGLAKR